MQAVHEMHTSGFCHADLKNSNAMVTHADGTVTVRLIDMACSQQQKPGMQILCPAQHWLRSICIQQGMSHADLVPTVRQASHDAAHAGIALLHMFLGTSSQC